MQYTIERAGSNDRDEILNIMRPWNMHNVPSPEMDELDLDCFFVAKIDDTIIGASGYKLLSPTQGKTTLLSVLPEFSGLGIGKALQNARLDAMHKAGVKTVTTNADRPRTIIWYMKHYGYRQVGTLKKVCSFGLPDVNYWTTIEMDLENYYQTIDEKK
ncbi:MAG: GNAT family N-acetyltransferase, partial [Sedimenticola sp.]|nr:GNAT family N-acetyltransferase [Sedimenticola sp.]